MDRSATVEYLKQVTSIGGEKLKKEFLDIVKSRSLNNISETEFSRALTFLFKPYPVLIENLIPFLPSFTRQILSQMNNLRYSIGDRKSRLARKFDYEKARNYVQLVRDHFESDKASFEKFQQLLNGVKLNTISFLESANIFGHLFCNNPEFIEGFVSFLKGDRRTKLYQVAVAIRQLLSYQLSGAEHARILNEILDHILYNRPPMNMLAMMIGSQALKITADQIPTLYLPKKILTGVRNKKKVNYQEGNDAGNGVDGDGVEGSKRFGKSYIEASADNGKQRSMVSSGRTSLCDSVINDVYIAMPNGSESYFKSSLKNPHEEVLFLIEDDAYELDMLIGRAQSTIRALEGFILQLKILEKNGFLVVNGQEGHEIVSSEKRLLELSIRSYHELMINKIVRDRITGTTDLMTQFKAQPGLYLVDILRRIKLQLEDYILSRKFFGNIWRESIAVHYDKSKNMQPTNSIFSAEDKSGASPNTILAEIRKINYQVIAQGRIVDFHLRLNFSNCLQLDFFNLYIDKKFQLESDINLLYQDIVMVLGAMSERKMSDECVSWFKDTFMWLVRYGVEFGDEFVYYGSRELVVMVELLEMVFSRFLLAKKLSEIDDDCLWDSSGGRRPMVGDATFLELSLSYGDLLCGNRIKKAIMRDLRWKSSISPFGLWVEANGGHLTFEYENVDDDNIQTDRIARRVESFYYDHGDGRCTFQGEIFAQDDEGERQIAWMDMCTDVPCPQNSMELSQTLIDQFKCIAKSINYINCFNRDENDLDNDSLLSTKKESVQTCQKYKKWLDLLIQVLEGNITDSEYDDWCLRLFGVKCHPLNTLHKTLVTLLSQIKNYLTTCNCKNWNCYLKEFFIRMKYLKKIRMSILERMNNHYHLRSVFDARIKQYINELLNFEKTDKIISEVFRNSSSIAMDIENGSESSVNVEKLFFYNLNPEFLDKLANIFESHYRTKIEGELNKDDVYYRFQLLPLGELLIKSVTIDTPQYSNPIHAWKTYIKSYFTENISKLNIRKRRILLIRNIRNQLLSLFKDGNPTNNPESLLDQLRKKTFSQYLSQCKIKLHTYQMVPVADSEDFMINFENFSNTRKKSNYKQKKLSQIIEYLAGKKCVFTPSKLSDELQYDHSKLLQEISECDEHLKYPLQFKEEEKDNPKKRKKNDSKVEGPRGAAKLMFDSPSSPQHLYDELYRNNDQNTTDDSQEDCNDEEIDDIDEYSQVDDN